MPSSRDLCAVILQRALVKSDSDDIRLNLTCTDGKLAPTHMADTDLVSNLRASRRLADIVVPYRRAPSESGRRNDNDVRTIYY